MLWIMTALWVALLLSLLALPIAFLPVGRACPRCASETVSIRFPLLRPLQRWLTRRWCAACGWEGIARCGRWKRTPSRPESAPAPREGADDDASWRGT